MPELSAWGRHFGKALCLSPERAALPFESLSPEEQACVRQVGLSAETKLEEHFGALAVPNPVQITYRLTAQDGTQVGELRYVDGLASLCVETPRQGQRCQILGDGPGAVNAALTVLEALGINSQRA